MARFSANLSPIAALFCGTFRTLPRVGKVALAVVLLGAAAFAQKPKVLAPHKPIPPRATVRAPLQPSTPRSMVGGLWMIDANFKSSIYIKNDLEASPITVTPLLYLSNGAKLTLPDITVEAAGTAVIPVNDALNAQGISPWATLTGYVEIQYKWPWDPVCVTVTSVDTIHSVIFTTGLKPSLPSNPRETAEATKGPSTQTIEGMWWKQEPGVSAFVALSNTSNQPVAAQLQVSDSLANPLATHSVTVSPRGTKTVNLSELQSVVGTSGGLRVTFFSSANQLIINGGLEDQATGYSAGIPFVRVPLSAAKPPAQSYAELGLMNGAADPMMQFPAGTIFAPFSLLRNISGQPATVTPSIYWMEGGTAHSAPLSPITLLPYQSQSLNVPALLAGAGLQNLNGSFNLLFDVAGSVLMASGSVDQSNTYVFQIIPRSVNEGTSKEVGYWSTANGDDTMVTLWNPADEAQDFVFTLFFSGGHYSLPVHLEARATRIFNLSEIAQSQIPDQDGNVIPAGIHDGSAKISGTHAENEHILLAMDVGIYNVRKATCGPVCIDCNGFTGGAFQVNGFKVPKNASTQLSLVGYFNTGGQYNLNSDATWTTSNSSIGTVSVGLTHGVSAGALTIGASSEQDFAGEVCNDYGNEPDCDLEEPISCSGSGTVQVPTSLSGPTLDAGKTYTGQALIDCGGTQRAAKFWGYRYCGTYTVLDQNGAPILQAGITLNEAITLVASNPAGAAPPTGTGITNASGQFLDTLAFGFDAAPSPVSGEYAIYHQTVTTSGQPNPLRINCQNLQYNAPTVKNITSGGTCP